MLQVCSYLHLLSVWRSGTSLDFSGFWGKTLSPYLPMVIHITRRIKSVVIYVVNLVHFSSFAQSCPTVCKPRDCSMPGLPVHHQLPGLAQTHVHQVHDTIQPSILGCPLLLPPIPPSIRVFSNESTLCMRWPKYSSFSFNIIPSKEIPGLISFRMDWLDLLAVQGTLKSLFQHQSSKASILQHSAFFIVQLSLHTVLLEKHSLD